MKIVLPISILLSVENACFLQQKISMYVLYVYNYFTSWRVPELNWLPVTSRSIAFAVKSIMPAKRQTNGRVTSWALKQKVIMNFRHRQEQRKLRPETVRVLVVRSRRTWHVDSVTRQNDDYSIRASVVINR